MIVDQPAPGGFLFHVQAEAIRDRPADQPQSTTPTEPVDNTSVASAADIIANFT